MAALRTKGQVYKLLDTHFRTYHDQLLATFFYSAGSRAEAEDWVSEAYTHALTKWHLLADREAYPDLTNFTAFLVKVGRQRRGGMTDNESVELVPITPKLEHGLPDSDDVEDNASLSEAQYRLESWILYEAPRERRMLREFFLEGASAPVIARKMKCNRALVYTIIRRFRERHGLVQMEVKDAA